MGTDGPNRGLGEGTRYLGMGLRFAGGTILFLLGGYALDHWTGFIPLFTVTGTLVGAVLSFLSVYRELTADPENQPRRRWWRKPRR